ncbi:P-loop containing nucleoside triphosphate hydrolase protein [Glomus cerebriforme]|uniref:RNA helicase n=1 Tax=Glomus cerebriforme TaxID=658196 RepID=A0A397SN85_9GLOM|nr:P-loop containing nucleoside triphosphate hydrolase protein [Glomus cerebriforme]
MPASAIINESNLDPSSKRDKKSKKKELDSQINESNDNVISEKKKSKSKNKKEKLGNDEDHYKKKRKDSKNSDSSLTSTKSKRKKHEDQVDDEVDEKSESSSSSKAPNSKKRKLSEKDLASVVLNNDPGVEDENSLDPNVKGIDDVKEIPENLKLSSYRLTQTTIDSLKKRGIEALFPIQAATFDVIYDGKDVLARAKTGTGKTLAFALPITEILLAQNQKDNFASKRRGRSPRVMVMTPTRDLANQVLSEFEFIAPSLKFLSIYGGNGGKSIEVQYQGLREGTDVIVGTPGRLLDQINRGNLKLEELKFICLDEADQMLDIGFAEDMETILQHVKNHKEKQGEGVDYQTLLFSATVPNWVKQTVVKYLKSDYVNVDLVGNSDTKTNENICHYAIRSSWASRKDIIGDVVACYAGTGSCVIFCNTKNDANELALNDKLKQDAQVLHGDIAQSQRETTLKGFRNGKFKCIICTDVLARGIDILQVDLVINCEPPKDVESYVHRAGRTARAGRQGKAVTFFKPQEEYLLQIIERGARIQFQIVGPPQPQDIISATANDAVKNLESVESSVLPYFHSTAKELIERQGAIEALSAALAYISGYSGGIKKRSLMSATEGYTTLLFKFNYPIRHGSYARTIVKKHFPNLPENDVNAFKLTKDSEGVVFDVVSDHLSVNEDGIISICGNTWYNTRTTTLEIAKELPELQENKNNNNGRNGWGRNSGGNFRNGSGGNRNVGFSNNNNNNNKNGRGNGYGYGGGKSSGNRGNGYGRKF